MSYTAEQARDRRATDPVYAEECRKAHRAWYQRNKDRHIAKKTQEYRFKKYGLTPAQYATMVDAQGGVCFLCAGHPDHGPGKTLNVDHCHSSGKLRKLLCSNCNRGIGLLQDNPELLHKAAEYIEACRETS